MSECNESSKINRGKTLRDLDEAEAGIKRVLEIARDTMQELQRVPDCDHDRLQDLSREYLETLKDVKDKCMETAALLSPSSNIGTTSDISVLKEAELLAQLSQTGK